MVCGMGLVFAMGWCMIAEEVFGRSENFVHCIYKFFAVNFKEVVFYFSRVLIELVGGDDFCFCVN